MAFFKQLVQRRVKLNTTTSRWFLQPLLSTYGQNNVHCRSLSSSYKKKFNKLKSEKDTKPVWERNFTDEPNLTGRADRIRQEIKNMTPAYEEDAESHLEEVVVYPEEEKEEYEVISEQGGDDNVDDEEITENVDIMFEHPELQKHTRKDKDIEHGYITLDKYGVETRFEFPVDNVTKESPWYQHCYKLLVETKGQNITYYRHLRPEADHILVCTCMSRLHIANVAYSLMDLGKELGRQQLRMEGLPEDDWVCIDSGDTLVHIFSQRDRDYYSIDLLYTVEHPYIETLEGTG